MFAFLPISPAARGGRKQAGLTDPSATAAWCMAEYAQCHFNMAGSASAWLHPPLRMEEPALRLPANLTPRPQVQASHSLPSMRLLNTRTWEMAEFISDGDVPPYAILSHTWGKQEVSFADWETRDSRDMSRWEGYRKIKQFGERAASDGFDWAWVDTYAISPATAE